MTRLTWPTSKGLDIWSKTAKILIYLQRKRKETVGKYENAECMVYISLTYCQITQLTLRINNMAASPFSVCDLNYKN